MRRTFYLIAGMALLALAWRLGGSDAMLAHFANPRWGWLTLALALTLPQFVLSAMRWRWTARQLGVALGPRDALAEYYLAGFLNLALPGGIGGDAARAWRGARSEGDAARAVLAVVIERAAGQIALVLAVVAVAIGPLAALGVVVALALVGRAAEARASARRRRWLVATARGLIAPRALAVQIPLSALITGTYLGVYLCAARGIGIEIPSESALTLVPLALLAMTLPLSIGGFGPREAAAAGLWGVAGLGADAGVAAALGYGAVNFAAALPGALLLGRRARSGPIRRSQSKSVSSPIR